MNTGNTMGIDFGLVNPAVCYVAETAHIKFFGDSKRYLYLKHKHKELTEKKQLSPKINQLSDDGINQFEDDVKNSRAKIRVWRYSLVNAIIGFARKEKVGTIKVEDLRIAWHISFHTCDACGYKHDDLRKKHKDKINPVYTYECRKCGVINVVKTEPELYRYKIWNVGQTIYLIDRKANEIGMEVIKIDPFNSSKKCPKCKALNISDRDRIYKCSCGFECDRDIVAAMNIANSVDLIHKWDKSL